MSESGLEAELNYWRAKAMKLRDHEGNARQMAAFLDSDRAPGETTWKSPFISRGSAIDQLIDQYESDRH